MATEGEEKRIGIFTTADRFSRFCALFADAEKDYLPRMDVDEAENPDYLGTLTKWDRAGYDVAIIDDAAMTDEARFIAAIASFFNSPRIKKAHLRIVFLATMGRTWNDGVIVSLLRNGAYDIVLPAKEEHPLGTLVELVSFPRKRSDVVAMLPKDNNFMVRISQEDSKKAVKQPDAGEQISHEEKVRRIARGRSTIAVASTRPFAGATHCSIALARVLVILHQEPAVVLNSNTFASFVSSYEVTLKSAEQCEINGIMFYDGGEAIDSSKIPWTKHSHIILDIGYIPWSKVLNAKTVEDRLTKQRLDSFTDADRQIIYVPAGNPADLEYFSKFLRARKKHLNQYALAFFGASKPIYDSMVSAVKGVAENVFTWQMPYLPWVLSMTKEQYLENEDVFFNALRLVLPRTDVEEYDARKAAQASSVTHDDAHKGGFFSRRKK